MRYLALLWNGGDSLRSGAANRLLRKFQSRAAGWQTVVEQPGLAVCCLLRESSRLDNAYVLPRGRGVVLGKLFDRSYLQEGNTNGFAAPHVVLDERLSSAIVRNAGQELIERYWGQYVAFLRDPASQRRWVVRDPSGGLPCQWTCVLGIDVYFVRLEDCERLGPLELSINRHYLLGYLLFNSSCVRETTFHEMETVLPGECIAHHAEKRTHTFAWNPLEIANAGIVEDNDEAVRMTKQTVRACVHAWASCFDGILHSLSGGLDSSIVVACLADAPTKPRVLCRNFYLTGTNADERVFARRAAERACFELIEQEARTDFEPESIHRTMRSLFPVGWPADTGESAAETQFLQSHGLSAEFRGHGGDEIFFRGGSFPTAVDYAWRHGVRPAVLSISLDDAALNQASVWRILRRVYHYGVRKRPWHPRESIPFSRMPLMTASRKEEARRDVTLWHPLYRGATNLPPGKFEHAYFFTYGTARTHDPLLGDTLPRVSPLMSQPLLELSLRTPLYVLRNGGRDRAIARRAFAGDVPAEIISRKSKAHGTPIYRAILGRNLRLVRELLLDGYLVREGFLDRTQLERALSGEVSRIQSETTEMCDYLSVETWARGWTEASTRFTPDRERQLAGTSPS